MFENLREDFRTYDYQWSRQGLWVMVVYRFGRWRYTIRRRWMRLPFSFLYKVLKPFSEILTGIELPCEATIGRALPHRPFWRHRDQRRCGVRR